MCFNGEGINILDDEDVEKEYSNEEMITQLLHISKSLLILLDEIEEDTQLLVMPKTDRDWLIK